MVESQEIYKTVKPKYRPLVLWLNGGPGCSSVAYGASEEVGPFRVRPDSKTRYLNPNAWSRGKHDQDNHPIISMASDLGGDINSLLFFITTTDQGHVYIKMGPIIMVGSVLNCMSFYNNGGVCDRRTGHYIPELSQIIARRNNGVKNPMITMITLARTYEFWWSHELISDSTYEDLKKFCPNNTFLFPRNECHGALERAYSEFGDINPYSIYSVPCNKTSNLRHNLKHSLPWKFRGNDECVVKYTKRYMNRPEVQRALHANITRIPHPWLETSISWHAWYDDHQQVGGWSQVYKGLTYVTVKGAGHEVPLTQPRLALILFTQFLKNEPMPALQS
ncbi:hypothetical protein OIU78_006300 [Salix suchowensis]|nr:hypothetical protein OIU78_006300 [Salix suchowensis]